MSAPVAVRPPGAATRRPAGWRGLLAVDGRMPSSLVLWLLGYVALYIVRPWERIPALETFPVERIYALVLLVRVFVLSSQWQLKLRGAGGAAAAFVGALALSTARAVEPWESWATFEDVLKVALFSLCIVAALRTRADVRAFVLGWIAIGYLYQAKAVWEHLVHGAGVYRMGTWRLIGIDRTFQDPNTFANTTVLLLPFLIELLWVERSRALRAWLLSAIALSVFVVVRTGSRTGLIAMVCLVLLQIVAGRRRLLFAALAIVGALGTVVLLPEQLVERYRTIFDPTVNDSAERSWEGRVDGLKKGVALLGVRPVTGVGPGCFIVADAHFSGLPGVPGLQPHNLLGQALGETGLFGTAVFALFAATLVRACAQVTRRARRARDALLHALGRASVQMLIVLFLTGLAGHNLYRYNWFWLAGLLVAMANVQARALLATYARRVRPRAEPAAAAAAAAS